MHIDRKLSRQYEFNQTPFGLMNTSFVFQCLLNKILIIAIYLDNILIHTQTVETGLFGLELNEGITLNPEKYTFIVDALDYSGYEIGKGTVED